MRETLHVRWHVTPTETPRLWLHCSRCARRTPFVSSGKFRVNAQKKRLDAWLVYRCAECDQSWNCPVYERCRVAEIDPAVFQAMAVNSAELARIYASDVNRLRRHSPDIDTSANVAVDKRLMGERIEAPRWIVISMAVPVSCGVRLDRLLAAELRLSRRDVQQLHALGTLTVSPRSRSALKQAVRDAQAVTLDLAALAPDLHRTIVAHVS